MTVTLLRVEKNQNRISSLEGKVRVSFGKKNDVEQG